MTTWGVSAQGHDAAIAVFNNDELVFAAHAERYSRVKNDPQLNNAIVTEALQFGEPEKIVWYEDQGLKWVRRAFTNTFNKKEITPAKYMHQFYTKKVSHKFVKHHRSHAAAGYYTLSLIHI